MKHAIRHQRHFVVYLEHAEDRLPPCGGRA